MRVSIDPIDLRTSDGEFHPYVTRTDADPEDVALVLAGDPTVDETRSQWQWFRLPNGDLVLGVFPQGDTYFSVVDRARI